MPVELWPRHAAPDGAPTAAAGTVGGGRGSDPSWSTAAGRGRATAAPSTARDLDDGAAARQGALGLELVGDQEGARLPLHRRRPRRRRPQQPVRAALRPARAGAPGRRASTRPTPTVEEAYRRAGPPGARSRTASARRADLRDYFRMQPEPRRRPRARRRWSRRRAAAGARSRAGTARPTCTATPRCRAGSTPGRCSARSTRWSGSGSAPSSCSTSTTGSRSTCPSRKRVHGYYVLPFLLGDRIVGRVDLKADRRPAPAGPGGVRRAARARRRPPSELAAELRDLAGWLRPGRHRGRAAGRPGRRARGRGQGRGDA